MAQETLLTVTSPGPSFPLPHRFPPIICFLLVLELGGVVVRLWCTHHPPNKQLLISMAVVGLPTVPVHIRFTATVIWYPVPSCQVVKCTSNGTAAGMVSYPYRTV
jgi:hypothetical protein